MLGVTIKPEELYFLGEMMQAKYIDYDYIAAMADIGQGYAAEKASVIRELGKKGMIEETLRGDVRVSADLQKLLRPVFFAGTENTLHILTLKPERSVTIRRFHVLDGTMTMVRMGHKQLKLAAVTEADIRALLRAELGSFRKEGGSEVLLNAVDRVIRVSSSRVGVGTRQKTYLLQGGVCYGADASDEPVGIPGNVMIEQMISVLKEA